MAKDDNELLGNTSISSSSTMSDQRVSKSLSQDALNVITNYTHIRAAPDLVIRCPYYRNPHSGERKWGLIVFSGKGSPEEITEELIMILKLENLPGRELNAQRVTLLMRKYRLGIDCAGFVFHVLDAELKHRHVSLLNGLTPTSKSVASRLSWLFRPLTHISVRLLTSPENAREVDERELKPGDLIVFFGETDHVALITQIVLEQGSVCQLAYAHASRDDGSGTVKEGLAVFAKSGMSFAEANLSETPDAGRLLTEGRSSPRFFRLKSLA